jgi:hypothetical protein
MEMKKISVLLSVSFVLLVGCAGIHDNLKIPAGNIAGDQFTGIRYPFRVSAPSDWKMTTEFPDFLKRLGYETPDPSDKEMTELYIFNPSTESNIQIDFTPANRGVQFSQDKIEAMTTAAMGSFKEELEKDYGKDIKAQISPTTPFSLKGVPYAAKKYATYTLDGVKREQGWIFASAERYQIFILYMLLDKGGSKDRQDMNQILGSFEFISQK